MVEVTLRKVTNDNWRVICKLELDEGQEQFVAPNWYSIIEAMFEPPASSCAVYAGEDVIGYAMHTIDTDTGEYWIARLMIAKAYQGKGYGRSTLVALVDQMRTAPDCKSIWISMVPENKVATHLYSSMGFKDTGRIEHGETVYRLDLD